MNSNDQNSDSDSAGASEIQALAHHLRSEINALQHELRRVRDGLERAGGVSPELEQRAKQLSKNIDLCEKDLKKEDKT